MPDDFLTPVTRTTLTGDICRKMVTHLIRGDWREAERIPPERELCQRLGVGRASLREALKALEIMGMIETRLGDGTYVCNRSDFLARPLLWAITGSSETEANELIEARKLIECELVGLASERATAEELTNIGNHLDRMEQALAMPEEFLRADIDFHLTIATAGHNRILLNALLLIRNLMRDWIRSTIPIEGVTSIAFDQHKGIFLALAKKNRAQASNLMRSHLNDMAHYLLVAQQTAGSPTQTNGLSPVNADPVMP
jgi:GntR family transcriptional repressor for pyruvate dehydrogenase complex